ncbi:MAG: hypothetical protein CVV25_04040 [Ignavibacteriae bacterium HGW-Ignavibacteriae-4]|jgi:restriction endonuclease S subunit|nr:MAG: hypothetical protein CVV25_04040 [Ignavibacteriae bacterium HGW-Ignavibacteriae-4]
MSANKLKDIAKIYSGYLFARRSDTDTVNGIKYKVLTMTDVNDSGLIDYASLQQQQLKPIQDKYLAKHKQVIIKCKGFNNDAYMIDSNVPNNIVITSFYFIIEVNEKIILPEFLLYVLNKKATQYHLGKLSSGTSIPNLTISTLNDFEIEVPPLEEQKKISGFYQLIIMRAQLMERLAELQKDYNLELINKYKWSK